MTEHDRIRRDRALEYDRNDLESLDDAIVGLQSTDDPTLCSLHDELQEYRQKLLDQISKNNLQLKGWTMSKTADTSPNDASCKALLELWVGIAPDGVDMDRVTGMQLTKEKFLPLTLDLRIITTTNNVLLKRYELTEKGWVEIECK